MDRVHVSGALPRWLQGTLVRVTPALFEIGGKPIRHYFDGLAMLNAFTFADGGVSYRSRFLQSQSYAEARKGRVGYLGFANDPCRAFFKRVATQFAPGVNDNCNVNVTRLGERYLAMTEHPVPLEFDLDTLDTLGLLEWQDQLGGHLFSAHPHHDPVSNELTSYTAHVAARSAYRIYTVAAGAERRREIASIPAKDVSYIHSFGLTANYIILAEFPLMLDPLRLGLSRSRPIAHQFRWEPERGTRFFVVSRRTGELSGTFEWDGFFAFHHVNAFERDDEIVADIVVHEDGPSAIRSLELERLRRSASLSHWQPRLHRYRIALNDGGRMSEETLSQSRIELPRINYDRSNAHDYRYVYAVAFRRPGSDYFDQLVKLDLSAREEIAWRQDECYPGEPVFVASPGAGGEDEGLILSVVLDTATGRSFLLVLDAQSFAEVARAELPHHIPFGFHGMYVPEGP